ncbi:MAG: phosphate ABC transporter ATP-binding protein [Candidatus Thermoplasmatota archaeon]|nr:phosphate ABC transporter ATP-binding protein [Candidatus Thermoplasmatota archaeon]
MSGVVEIKDLVVKAGEKTILNGINIQIHKNKVNTVLGPSGGGKSTLLKVMNRLTDLDRAYTVSGEVLLNGKDIRSYNTIELRRRVGMIFQRPTPFPLSIYDNVAFGIRLQSKTSREDLELMVRSSLEDAGLWSEVKDDLRRSATTLSGGQQQRLCIARAIILRPNVVLMDEPTSSLDPTSKSRIEDLILDLKEKYTVVLVTHDIAQAKKVSDYTSLLFNGKIVASGEGGDLLENSSSASIKSFLGEVSAR